MIAIFGKGGCFCNSLLVFHLIMPIPKKDSSLKGKMSATFGRKFFCVRLDPFQIGEIIYDTVASLFLYSQKHESAPSPESLFSGQSEQLSLMLYVDLNFPGGHIKQSRVSLS